MKYLIALIALMPLSIFAQESKLLILESNQIEAIESHDGTYARFADIAEGYVKFEGVEPKNNSLTINLNNTNLNSIYFQDGSQLNQKSINQVMAASGGDMGGGGAALLLK